MYRALTLALVLAPSLAIAEPIDLKVLSFNIWYGGDQVNFGKVIEAIKAADADIVGLQEPDGKTAEIAALAGYPYYDIRRHIISRYPLFDSGVGERLSSEAPPYTLAGTDTETAHVWALVGPGKVVALSNLHLTSDPYGPELLRDGSSLEEVLQNEADTRMPEIEALLAGLQPLAASGVPVVLTGDFNTPSHRDYAQGHDPAVEWPVSLAMEAAGFTDSFRAVHPDPVADPGLTWTAGRPWPYLPEGETLDRIDFVWAANASASASIVVGEPGNPAVGISVNPWPSDHRAVISTLSLEPAAAPNLIAVEPTLVALGDSFLIRANVPAGATWTGLVVPRDGGADAGVTGIADVSIDDRPTIRLSTIGLEPGPYDALLLDAEGTELARTRFSILPESGKAEIAVTAPVTTGGDIALSFAGAPGFKYDWIGIYRAGDPSVYNYLGFAYTGARREGTTLFPASDLYEELAPGNYEARLMLDDHYVTMAIAPFTVE